MEPLADLEENIRKSYEFISEYQKIRRDTSDPKEKSRCEHEIATQRPLLQAYLKEYYALASRLKQRVSDDIREIAAYLLTDEFQQAYQDLQQIAPEGLPAVERLLAGLREFGHYHERLNELKDLHNHLQECLTKLQPLKGELDIAIAASGPEQLQDRSRPAWNRGASRRLWDPCRTQLGVLETFARQIKHIDIPYDRIGEFRQGPAWMIQIASLRDDLNASLYESDLLTIHEMTDSLWDTVYSGLYQADKRLRDQVGELYEFSRTILRSLENDIAS